VDAFGFVADAFTGFVTAFFAAFLTDFLTAFLVVFFAFTARFFPPAGFLARVLAARFVAFLAFFFFADFLATTKSLNWLERICLGSTIQDAYRVASASSENTEKTSGFRSRL
jgi:hypothetical protein